MKSTTKNSESTTHSSRQRCCNSALPKSNVASSSKSLSPLELFRRGIDAELSTESGTSASPSTNNLRDYAASSIINACTTSLAATTLHPETEEEAKTKNRDKEGREKNGSDIQENGDKDEIETASNTSEAACFTTSVPKPKALVKNLTMQDSDAGVVKRLHPAFFRRVLFKHLCSRGLGTIRSSSPYLARKSPHDTNFHHSVRRESGGGSSRADVGDVLEDVVMAKDKGRRKNKALGLSCLGQPTVHRSPRRRHSTDGSRVRHSKSPKSPVTRRPVNLTDEDVLPKSQDLENDSQSRIKQQRMEESTKRQGNCANLFKKVMIAADPSTDVKLDASSESTEAKGSFGGCSATSVGAENRNIATSPSASGEHATKGLRTSNGKQPRKFMSGHWKRSQSPSNGLKLTNKLMHGSEQTSGYESERRGQNNGNVSIKMADYQPKDNSNNNSQNGFTAFVPFQGFAVFSNQGAGSQRTDPSASSSTHVQHRNVDNRFLY